MSEYLGKEEVLLGATLPEQDVPVRGGKVRVRALSRAEAMEMFALDGSASDKEDFILATALVNPTMDLDEVKSWRARDEFRTLRDVSDAVIDLSGLLEDAEEALERSFRPD